MQGLLAAGLPMCGMAGVSANLSWTASSDTNVTGYTIYYGRVSRQYTNTVSVGKVTTAAAPNLLPNTTYFFSAKARNNAGVESDFSNETAFAGVTAIPNGKLSFKALAKSLTNHPVVYSLAPGGPPDATINPTNGTILWTPSRAYASTTNTITVNVTDTVTPALSTKETVVVFVSDYLDFRLGNAAAYAGQTGSLPITVACNSTVTNMQLTLAWPGNLLTSPSLNISSPSLTGTMQNLNNQLVIQLQAAANQSLKGTNQVATVNFIAANGQPSTILNIPVLAGSGSSADGADYANVVTGGGEVAIVGAQSMLRPRTSATGRCLSLFASPGTYVLQYANSLVPPVNWQPLVMYQQTNASQTVSLGAAEPVIFYRLQQL